VSTNILAWGEILSSFHKKIWKLNYFFLGVILLIPGKNLPDFQYKKIEKKYNWIHVG
jgi:hypothetical protein